MKWSRFQSWWLKHSKAIQHQKNRHQYGHGANALYLGRGVNFPVALEGALKLKEILTFTQRAIRC